MSSIDIEAGEIKAMRSPLIGVLLDVESHHSGIRSIKTNKRFSRLF